MIEQGGTSIEVAWIWCNLKVKGIKKDFGNQHVLRRIELEVQKGVCSRYWTEWLWKKYTVETYCRLRQTNRGRVVINDQPVQELNPECAYHVQDARLLPWKRVMDKCNIWT